jgi:hypothetical protein
METTLTILEMLLEAADRKPTESTAGSAVEVDFNWTVTKETQCRRTNKALENMSDDERITFLTLFLKLWTECGSSHERWSELHGIVGYEHDHLFGSRLMYTYTSNRRQFRCWYGIPKSFRREHVDSCGEGLLFSVYGDPFAVLQYIETLLGPEVRRKSTTLMDSGCTIYNLY